MENHMEHPLCLGSCFNFGARWCKLSASINTLDNKKQNLWFMQEVLYSPHLNL